MLSENSETNRDLALTALLEDRNVPRLKMVGRLSGFFSFWASSIIEKSPEKNHNWVMRGHSKPGVKMY